MLKFPLGLKRSSASSRGRAETGGPVVSMWCVMSCFTGVSGEETTLMRAGNSDSRVR